MLLETPKTEGRPPGVVAKDPLDERNLGVLRDLLESPDAQPAIAET
jgi:hypothetical protein